MEVAWILLGIMAVLGGIGVSAYRRSAEARLKQLTLEHESSVKLLVYEGEKRIERVERSSAKAQTRAQHQFAKDLLAVVDAIDAASALPQGTDAQSLARGIALVKESFETAFATHGIHTIEPKGGTLFDPSVHEAVDLQDGFARHVVVSCLRVGFRQGEDVLRPAMVAVGSGEGLGEEE